MAGFVPGELFRTACDAVAAKAVMGDQAPILDVDPVGRIVGNLNSQYDAAFVTLLPGSKGFQLRTWQVGENPELDSNETFAVWAAEIQVARALVSEGDELLYLASEMPDEQRRLIEPTVWKAAIANFQEYETQPAMISEPDRVGNVITYTVGFTATIKKEFAP